MTKLITGAAGFVGANLVARLLNGGASIAGFDNLSLGSLANLQTAMSNPNFTFQAVDLSDITAYRRALDALHSQQRVTEIWHLAASSDIPAGVSDPRVDLRDTFMTTFNTLVLMREFAIDTIAFASTSAVYGDQGDRPLTEDIGPLFPISNYGAMKLASEASISAASESHLERAFIFRFPNVIGVPATHGVILDFVRKLGAMPKQLHVLGDGSQRKSYLHIDELIDAMLFVRERSVEKLAYYNIGPNDDGITVQTIAEMVVARVASGAGIQYGSGSKGWVGDVPKFRYSTAKLDRLGWRPKLSSPQAVEKAVAEIVRQEAGR